MAKTTILVRAAHTALVPDYEAQDCGILRFVNRRRDAGHGEAGGWVPLDGPSEIPYRAEYIQELKAGCLLPANEETARLAGVAFEVTSGS